MKRIIDIHMHVIPDADDGPDTMEEALELLRRSSEQGVTDIIATSHDSAFFGKAEQTVLKYLDLKRAAAEANIPVSLYLGAELYLDLKHMESDILPKLKDGSYPTLNGTKYVLVEFSTREREEDICACLDCLLEEGYYPVLAHAERYQNLHHETIARLKQRGILIQINLYSIEDENDFVIRGRTNQYLQMSLVDVIGSDTHRLNHRPPVLQNGIEALYRNFDKDYVEGILYENAVRYFDLDKQKGDPRRIGSDKEKEGKQLGNNKWFDGIMGVVVGDSLGVPYEFQSREEIKKDPATDMRGYGTYNMPPGTWSDDSSMTLASLVSLNESRRKGEPVDFQDMMERFVFWAVKGEYTPYGEMFDIGGTTLDSIHRYRKNGQDIFACGGSGEHDNGNGSLMRIMPVCLYAYELQKDHGLSDEDALTLIHTASGLTHNHIRSKVACGLYYFCVRAILDEDGSLLDRLQSGIDQGWAFYKNTLEDERELFYYNRCRRIQSLKETSEKEIFSGGYVVQSFTASLWCLLNTDNYRDCVLLAVNLGFDTDTTAAIAGGLAGLYYGYDAIPEDWLKKIARREWIEDLCDEGK